MKRAAFALSLLASAPAGAEVFTTQELYACLSTVSQRTSECLRYTRGVVDGLVRAQAQWGGGAWFCMPEEDQFGTIVGDFARWYARNRHAGAMPASMVIQLAIMERFPCKL